MRDSVWYCPLCHAEGADPNVVYCPEDGGQVRPISERGAEWIGKTIADKYKVVSFVGAGGMADVYEVERLSSGKRLALKILKSMFSSDPQLHERFRQEAMLISLIAHRNVVAMEDFGVLHTGANYMVMELLAGHSLGEVMSMGSLTPLGAFQIVMQACEGMAAAHERGVIHRDLKPENLFLQDTGNKEKPLVKILDLGIGKLFTGRSTKGLTVAGTVFGTPEYMSPEQATGKYVDEKSDIYSMGVVLYEMLLGKAPFEDSSHVVVLSKHVSEEPVWDRKLAASFEVPPEAEPVILRALKKDPTRRQQSMLELQSDVAGLLSRVRHGENYSLPSAPTGSSAAVSAPAATIPANPVRIVPLAIATGGNTEVVELGEGIYWVGRRHGSQLECNAYLRVFKGASEDVSVLIDPGPPRDLDTVMAKVAAILGSVEALDYIYLNHQDPDVAANAAYLQQVNSDLRIVCSEDTWRLARHYGLDPKRHILVESMPGMHMDFGGGRTLQFVPTPFCHFRGAVMLYDTTEEVLFSGDLFGGTTSSDSFVADRNSFKGIKLFHEIYMPSKRALLRAIAETERLNPFPRIIAPQHGSILIGEELQDVLDKLKKKKLGMDMLEANEQDPEALRIANKIVQIYADVAGADKATDLVRAYSADGTFSNIFDLKAPTEITSFRVDSNLAIETLLHDVVKTIPRDKEHTLLMALVSVRRELLKL